MLDNLISFTFSDNGIEDKSNMKIVATMLKWVKGGVPSDTILFSCGLLIFIEFSANDLRL